MKVYPIKFEPILKEKVWGGNKLKNQFNKKTTKDNIGESWEVSAVPENISKISNGLYKGESLKTIQNTYKADFLGTKNYKIFGDDFPLLIKFIDAESNLSIQVHPDDQMAKKNHNSFGKTEMWYVMEHEDDAELIAGLSHEGQDLAVAFSKINNDNYKDLLQVEKVKKGDSFFIPSGQVHAIGAGIMVAEIQQTSDVTYRIFDWERKDHFGNTRELHTQQALEATHTTPLKLKKEYDVKNNKTSNVVTCQYFTTNVFQLNKQYSKDYRSLDSFVILICVEGNGSVCVNNTKEHVKQGQSIVLPAVTNEVQFIGESAKFLEVYIAA